MIDKEKRNADGPMLDGVFTVRRNWPDETFFGGKRLLHNDQITRPGADDPSLALINPKFCVKSEVWCKIKRKYLDGEDGTPLKAVMIFRFLFCCSPYLR